MKYLVMECHPSYAVVLDEQGRFLRAANCGYQVGQTVTEITEMELPQPRKTIHWVRQFTAVAACLVLMLSMLLLQSPYASVYLSINPQVRVDVNRQDRVVSVVGINEDGTALLQGYDHRRKNLDTVMDELVDRAIDMGYLLEGGTVKLTLEASEKWVVSHQTHLQEEISNHVADRITIHVDFDDDDDDDDDDDHDDDDDDDRDDRDDDDDGDDRDDRDDDDDGDDRDDDGDDGDDRQDRDDDDDDDEDRHDRDDDRDDDDDDDDRRDRDDDDDDDDDRRDRDDDDDDDEDRHDRDDDRDDDDDDD